MASPSNKKDGKAFLNKFSKDELIEKAINLTAEITDLRDEKNKLEIEFLQLKKEKESLQRKLDKFNTSDELIKKILSYRARNYSPVIIRDKLKLDGIDMPLEKIKDIISGELSTELELYFVKCKEEYIESIKINTSFYKQSSIDDFQRLIDSGFEDLENFSSIDDIKLRDSLRNTLGNLIAKRDALMKNIDENATNTEEEELLTESFNEYKNSSEKIIQLFSDKIKVIGGGDK